MYKDELIKVMIVVMIAGAIFMCVRRCRESDQNVKIQTCWTDSSGKTTCAKRHNGVIAG